MKKVSVSFPLDGKNICLERDVDKTRPYRLALGELLDEARVILNPGTASSGQFRAFWARARGAGLDKEAAQALLQEKFGGFRREQLVGRVPAEEFSSLIDGLPGREGFEKETEVASGMVTAAQLRSFWARALAVGWDREKVCSFLTSELGDHRDAWIVGRVSADRFQEILQAVAA